MHVSVKNHDRKKPQEAASRPFLLFSYEKDRLEIVETAYENKNREGFIVACTCLSPIFFFFLFLVHLSLIGFVPATAC